MDYSKFINMPRIKDTILFKRGSEKPFYHPLHFHDDCCEFLLIIKGEGEFVVDGKPYSAKGGNLMCYNRSTWHMEQSTSETFDAMYVGFSGLQIKDLPSDHFLTSEQHALINLGDSFIPIKQLFADMISEHRSMTPEADLIANQLLGVLLGRLSRHVHYEKETRRNKRPSVEAIEFAKRQIELNYRSDINLEALSELTHISTYHFCDLFKQVTGTSPIQYLILYRLEVAKHYLSTTDMSISEISELIGYRNDTYFQNIFKKKTGVAPGRFRSQSRL